MHAQRARATRERARASPLPILRRRGCPSLRHRTRPPRARLIAQRNLTKPMSLAYSRKHWRHMLRPYLRMRPHLEGEGERERRGSVSDRREAAAVGGPASLCLLCRFVAAADPSSKSTYLLPHARQERPPLACSLLCEP